ncbi:MAG: hypothetical protein ACM3W4_10060 [Ignavibacteriales bacterium]
MSAENDLSADEQAEAQALQRLHAHWHDEIETMATYGTSREHLDESMLTVAMAHMLRRKGPRYVLQRLRIASVFLHQNLERIEQGAAANRRTAH